MTNRMSLPLLIVAPILVLLILCYWFFVAVPAAASSARLTVDGHPFLVEVADTHLKQLRGLSGRRSLGEGRGMLFTFDEGFHPMWMPNMKFAIDILWIRDGRVVEIATLNPPTLKRPMPESYTPRETSDWVLEIPAGTAKKLGIGVGAEVSGMVR